MGGWVDEWMSRQAGAWRVCVCGGGLGWRGGGRRGCLVHSEVQQRPVLRHHRTYLIAPLPPGRGEGRCEEARVQLDSQKHQALLKGPNNRLGWV